MTNSPDIQDIERQVAEFMLANGITPPKDGLQIDGRLHRFATEHDRGAAKSGSYRVYPDNWPSGWVQDFRLGDPIKWKYSVGHLDASARAEWGKHAGSQKARAEWVAEERRRQDEKRQALIAARAVYDAASPVEESCDHPYLLEKRVTPRGGFPVDGKWHGLRVGAVQGKSRKINGVLLIPMADISTGEFIALHRVFPWRDKETGKFPKGWHPGTSGGIFPIGIDVPRGPVFCGEGIGTALSMYDIWIEEGEPENPGEYQPCCTVLATMDSGNLARQARAIRERYPDRRLLVVKDADEAGEKAARAAMEAGFDGAVDSPAGTEG
jgi:putative DNA primase/helicase